MFYRGIKFLCIKKGISFDALNALTKLSLVSLNGLGALTYEPTQSKMNASDTYDLDALAKEVKHIDNDALETDDFDLIYRLGFASGGARPKVHMTIDDKNWIIKFSSSLDSTHIGKLEY